MTGLATGIAARAVVPAVVKGLPWRWIFDLALAAAFLGLLAWGIRVNDLRDRWRTQYAHEHQAHLQTVANYRAAAEAARKADAANKARVEAEQAKISKEQSDEYEARIAAARATAERLRKQLAQAHPGGSGTAPVSGVPTPTGKPPEKPQDGFSIDDRLTATEQAIQLDELIKWVKRQHEIDPNKR